MARGHPDYTTTFGKTGEAVFLQESSLGNIWWIDNMEAAACKWVPFLGAAVITTVPGLGMNVSEVYEGDGSLHITGGAGIEFSCGRRFGGLPAEAQLSTELAFLIKAHDDFQDRTDAFRVVSLVWRDGTRSNLATIYYNPRDDNWYFRNTAAGRTFIVNYHITEQYWHFIRLVIDPTIQEYISLRIDSNIWNLRGNGYRSTLVGGNVRTSVNIGGFSDALDQVEVWADNYIIRYGVS